MKIGLVGETYNQLSLPFDAQRSINLFPILDKTGKEVASMYGTPGLILFTNLGSAVMREEFISTTGRAFAVCGSSFYEVDVAGAKTLRGTLDQNTGIVYIVENPIQIGICDGQSLYIMDLATNVFSKVIGGREYCVNGDFTSAAGWTTGAGWVIAAGVATATTASSDLSRTAAFTVVAGQPYQITYTITRSAGTVQPKIGGTAGVVRSGAGTFSELIIAGATQDIAFTGVGFTGTLDNVTVNDQAFGLPVSIGTLCYLDSFFIVNQNNSGKFFKSAPNNGRKWDALDFATAESSPDNLLRVVAAIDQLWLVGQITTEIWTNTGASAFPFQKISGGKMTKGTDTPATALELDNTLFFVGRGREGGRAAYRAKGFIPSPISTDPINIALNAATDPANMRSYAYEQDGHVFWVITGGGLATSLVYDINTGMWHEKAYLNSQGMFEPHLGCCYMNAFGKHLVGDRTNGNIYIMDRDTYTDNGDPLAAVRVYTHLSDEDKMIRYNSLVIGVEPGVGLQNGQGSLPVIEMRLSKDGAKTWSDIYKEPIGAVGEYRNKAEFRRLGVAEQMTFEIRITDPVKRAITGSYLK